MALGDARIAPGAPGPGRHVHTHEDEGIYVVTGIVTVEVGEERYEVGAESFFWLPREVPHVFANLGTEATGTDDELHLFSAPDLRGEWKPHRRNPVKCDVRSSRPAGRLFERDGALYRPAQICAPLYGSGIALHRVTQLDDDGYAESEERRIIGKPPLLGMHTINRAGDFSVTDAFARRRRF